MKKHSRRNVVVLIVGITLGLAYPCYRWYYSVRQQIRYDAENRYDAGALGACLEAMSGYIYAHKAYPPADHWEEAIQPYRRSGGPMRVTLYTPPGQQQHRFAMNSSLSGKPFDGSYKQDGVVVLYETISDKKDANGIPNRLPGLHPDWDVWKQVDICGSAWDDETNGCNSPAPHR